MTDPAGEQHDAVIVGGGFAGLYSLHALRARGLDAIVLERGESVGGVWHWNTYPGARCDLEGRFYCYSFSPEFAATWTWRERYPNQDEIRTYLRRFADHFGLGEHIRLNTTVRSAAFDEATATWTVTTADGSRISCRWLIGAVGSLSAAQRPAIPGIESFAGRSFHTGEWPQSPVDFTGRRVGVIGTGSSGVQVIPIVAEQARHLTVFQRTPSFVLPARNRPWDAAEQREQRAALDELRMRARDTRGGVVYEGLESRNAVDVTPEEREAQFDSFFQQGGARFISSFPDLLKDPVANEFAAEYLRRRIREVVADPETARKLTPTTYPLGAKRPCVGTGYYETFNRDDVTLLDIAADPIVAIEESGIRTTAGLVELDDIVFATGYDAMTGALARIDIRGRDGLALSEAWHGGPQTYLGLATHGFPNLFLLAGAGSPSVLVNVVAAIEQQVEWVAGLLGHAAESGVREIEADPGEQAAWGEHVQEVAAESLYVEANSWYLGANIPGKPRVFMPYAGGLDRYTSICHDVASSGYRGFRLGT